MQRSPCKKIVAFAGRNNRNDKSNRRGKIGNFHPETAVQRLLLLAAGADPRKRWNAAHAKHWDKYSGGVPFNCQFDPKIIVVRLSVVRSRPHKKRQRFNRIASRKQNVSFGMLQSPPRTRTTTQNLVIALKCRKPTTDINQ